MLTVAGQVYPGEQPAPALTDCWCPCVSCLAAGGVWAAPLGQLVRVGLSPPHTRCQVAVLWAVPGPPRCLVTLAPTMLFALSPAMDTRGPLLPPGWQGIQTGQ